MAVNEAVTSAPEAVNEDPYAAWLFRLKPADKGALAGMLDAAAYTALIGEA
jgi:glycine cleavage system H protein